MRTGRLEAFSDGVLAIIITIMVLELRPPDGASLKALGEVSTGLLTYLLSFVYVGIYWTNHHHYFALVKRVTGSVLWSNLALLFILSLLPFTTAWMDEQHFAKVPVAIYGVNLLLAGLAFNLVFLTVRRGGGDEHLARAMATGSFNKGTLSVALYFVGIAVTFINPWLGFATYAGVALVWLIPDRRAEKYIAEHGPIEQD